MIRLSSKPIAEEVCALVVAVSLLVTQTASRERFLQDHHEKVLGTHTGSDKEYDEKGDQFEVTSAFGGHTYMWVFLKRAMGTVRKREKIERLSPGTMRELQVSINATKSSK